MFSFFTHGGGRSDAPATEGPSAAVTVLFAAAHSRPPQRASSVLSVDMTLSAVDGEQSPRSRSGAS